MHNRTVAAALTLRPFDFKKPLHYFPYGYSKQLVTGILILNYRPETRQESQAPANFMHGRKQINVGCLPVSLRLWVSRGYEKFCSFCRYSPPTIQEPVEIPFYLNLANRGRQSKKIMVHICSTSSVGHCSIEPTSRCTIPRIEECSMHDARNALSNLLLTNRSPPIATLQAFLLLYITHIEYPRLTRLQVALYLKLFTANKQPYQEWRR